MTSNFVLPGAVSISQEARKPVEDCAVGFALATQRDILAKVGSKAAPEYDASFKKDLRMQKGTGAMLVTCSTCMITNERFHLFAALGQEVHFLV